MNMTVFDLYHPAVQAAFFAAVILLGMMAFQPVYIVLTCLAGFLYGFLLRGWRATLRSALWQLPLVLIVAVANPLFSASGSTELFRIGLRAVYLESLVYGACMGLMLVSVILWFSNASHVLTSDKIMALFGNVSPTVSLMMSMASRLVPQFVRRGREIDAAQKAMRSARPDSAGSQASMRARQVSVLMGWSMEDSLETAEAMRARGWGSGVKRTTYARFRFRARDAVACCVVGALVAANVFLAWVACSQFAFYPTLSELVLWWGYVPYALLLLLPCALQVGEEIRWR